MNTHLEPSLKLKWLPHFTVFTFRKKLRNTFFQPSIYGWYRAKTSLYLYFELSKNGLATLLRRQHPIIQPDEENFYTDEIHLWWDNPLIYTVSLEQFKQILIQSLGYIPEYNQKENSIALTNLIEISTPKQPNDFTKPHTYIQTKL
jgi:hypothetical protein